MAFELTEPQRQRVIHELQKRGAILPCSRCATEHFTLANTLGSLSLGDGKSFIIGGQEMPTFIVVCVNCGAIYLHSVGVLGLFDEFGF